MSKWEGDLNIAGECRMLKLSFWQCPPFLFICMGCVTVVSMVATYLLASRYALEPQVAALIVIFVAALFFVIGNLVISGFNKIVEANRTKSEFVSIVSHQLGTPLSIFKMTLGLLARDLSEVSEAGHTPAPSGAGDIRGMLATLSETTESMIRLVHSLLEVSKIEAHRVALQKADFSLNSLTEKIIAGSQKYASAANIEIVLHPDPALPLVHADPDRTAMVVQNLLDNAIRYTPGKGAVTISTEKKGTDARWSIRDTGIGIPPSARHFIFQKFFRADNGASQETHGSGIGLYIAKAVVEASGGRIGFESGEQGGTTFWFTLPINKK